MNYNLSIPKRLLEQIDFQNTIDGGVSESTVKASHYQGGFRLEISTPGIDVDNLHIEAINERFAIYHLIDVLEGTEQVPHYIVNIPLTPEVNIDGITAKLQNNGLILVNAPYNDWVKKRNS